jgi:hypothetical protein
MAPLRQNKTCLAPALCRSSGLVSRRLNEDKDISMPFGIRSSRDLAFQVASSIKPSSSTCSRRPLQQPSAEEYVLPHQEEAMLQHCHRGIQILPVSKPRSEVFKFVARDFRYSSWVRYRTVVFLCVWRYFAQRISPGDSLLRNVGTAARRGDRRLITIIIPRLLKEVGHEPTPHISLPLGALPSNPVLQFGGWMLEI